MEMERKAERWCANSSTPQAIENFLKSKLDSDDPEHAIQLDKFISTLSVIGYHRYNPAQLDQCTLYRWNLEIEFDENETFMTHMNKLRSNLLEISDKHQQTLPKGFKYVLQLQDLDGKWDDWLFVQKSKLPDAGNGLFAARRFTKNCIIGYYCGNVLDKRKYDKHTKKLFYRKENDKQIDIRDNDYHHITVDSTSINVSKESNLYMGLQFLNSVSLGKKKIQQRSNVSIGPAGCVTAERDIEKGSELLWDYK